MWMLSFAKYRGLFISTTAFCAFFLLYLLVNGVMQRNTIASVEYVAAVTEVQHRLDRLGVSKDVIDALDVIKTGGTLRAIDDAEQSMTLLTLPPIQQHLSPVADNMDAMSAAISAGNASQLRREVDTLLTLVIDKKERSLKLARTLSVIAAILTVMLYFMVLVQFVLRLSKTDVSAVQSRQETDSIMSTISEGIFLLDSQFTIGAEQSASLKAMFKSDKDLEGDFLEFISHYVTQNNVGLAREYLTLLFGDRVKERLVEELNPLKQVEVSLVRRDGSFESHYLDFKFKRVLVDEKISHLLCSVNDVTKQVLLEQELASTREAQEAQLDMLKSILHVDANKLSLFFTQSEMILQDINKTLEVKKKGFSDAEIRSTLQKIAAKMHRIKGDAAALGLHKFEFLAHDFEEEIDRVKSDNKKITGKELLPLITLLRTMFGDLEDMKTLVDKFSGIRTSTNVAAFIDDTDGDMGSDTAEIANISSIDIAESLQQLVTTVAYRNEKSVTLKSQGLDANSVPSHLVSAVQSITTQLVRNSIVHGVESVSEREAADKPLPAIIDVRFATTSKGYFLSVKDDGCGVDEALIIQRAVDQGLISAEKAAVLPLKKAPVFLFHPGFSIREQADIDAGRGVGLEVVKQLVDETQGKLNVSYEKGKYCQFRILFPLS
ncbi:ATP-binding protein [Eionea flava]